MRWQSVARAVVALIGIGCAVAVYLQIRPREEIVPIATTPAMLDTNATAVATTTKIKQVDEKGVEEYSMEAGERVSMADGRTLLKKGVTFKFAKGEVRYVVTGTEAEASGKHGPTGEQPSQVVFKKKVKMTGDNGFSVEAEDATYFAEEQRVAFPGAVVFTRERMSGAGVGADLFMDRSVLWLNDKASMTIRPEGAGVPVFVSGKKIGLAQNDGYLRAEEGARLTRDSQRLSSDFMTVHFSEGTQSVRRIELLGHSSVQRTGTGQRPDMRGDDIDLDFIAETSMLTHARMSRSALLTLREDAGVTSVKGDVIDFYVGADGETLTKLNVTGPTELILPRTADSPERTIQSSGLVAEGTDPKGLERAVFSGGTRYREMLPAARGQAAAVRLATSDSLALDLGGALNQVTVARFQQNFCFLGPMAPTALPAEAQCAAGRMLPVRGTLENTTAAKGDEGTYDAKAETLKVRASAPTRPSPHVENPETQVRARQIDIDIKQDAIAARGQVVFDKKSPAAKAKASQTTGLFESGRPITVKSNTLAYSKTTGVATYGGEVRMIQPGAGGELSFLQGDDVTVDDQKQDVKATGHVSSTFFIEQTSDDPAKKTPTATVLTGDSMTYVEAQRRAVYSGKATMVTGEAANKQSLDAEQITLELHAGRRALKWLEGVTASPGFVLAKLPDGRQTTGQRVTYDAETDLYVVTGQPARVVTPAPAKGAGVCEVGTGNKVEFARKGGGVKVTTEGVTAARAVDQQRCAEVIK